MTGVVVARVIVTGVVMAGVIGVIVARVTVVHALHVAVVLVAGAFGGWRAAQKKFFADGGVFDQVYTGR